MRRAWKSPHTEQDEISRYMFWPGSQTSMSYFLGAAEHALVLLAALFRGGDGDQLHLGELVQTDHPARVLAGGASFGAEARSEGGETDGQFGLVDDRFADQVGERD